jgi:hypothetical protein
VNTHTTINKNEYAQALENNQLMKQFSNEIAVAAHTWSRLVVQPFLETLPDNLLTLYEKITQLRLKIIKEE